MKALIGWIGLFAFLFCGVASVRADDPNVAPRWTYYLRDASILYQSGVCQTQTDPAKAVKTLRAAQDYLKLAISAGASTWAVQLDQAISKALVVAENTTVAPKVVVQKPGKQGVTVRTRSSVVRIR